MTNRKYPIDMNGWEIHSGDIIYYPIRSGSAMWMGKAIVEKIIEIQNDSSTEFKLKCRKFDSSKRFTFSSLYRCVRDRF